MMWLKAEASKVWNNKLPTVVATDVFGPVYILHGCGVLLYLSILCFSYKCYGLSLYALIILVVGVCISLR